MNLLGDPQMLRDAATQLDQKAQAVIDSGIRLAKTVQASTWAAPPRSDRFRAEMDARRRDAEHAAEDLHRLASDIRTEATKLDHELAQLKSLEKRVRNEVDRLSKLGLPLPFTAPFSPARLPVPGDPKWRSVARLFGLG